MQHELIAMFFGVVGTVIFHISKGMQQQGIEILHHIKHKLFRKHDYSILHLKTKTIIYAAGVFLNNTIGIWIILANRFAPPSYYTSMYGLGLIALLVYSSTILHEKLKKNEYVGAVMIVLGTIILGLEGLFRKDVDMTDINAKVIIFITIIFISFSLFLYCFIFDRKSPLQTGILFGIITGWCASLDQIYKSIGQSLGGSPGFLPSTPTGIFFFIISFCFTTSAFFMTQYAFAKRARAAVLVPIQNSIYVIFPIVIQALSLKGFRITVYTILGMFVITSGIFFMQIFRGNATYKNEYAIS